jgi:hypothetical protein
MPCDAVRGGLHFDQLIYSAFVQFFRLIIVNQNQNQIVEQDVQASGREDGGGLQ